MEAGDLVTIDFGGYEAWYQESVPNGVWAAGYYQDYGPFTVHSADEIYAHIKFVNPNEEWDRATAHIPLQFVSKVESE